MLQQRPRRQVIQRRAFHNGNGQKQIAAFVCRVRIDARLQIFDDAGTSAFVDCLNQTSHIPAHSAKQGGARRRRGKGTKEALAARSATFKGNADGSDCSRAAFATTSSDTPAKTAGGAADFRLYSGGEDARRERRGFGVGVLRRYIWLCVRINLRITGKAR